MASPRISAAICTYNRADLLSGAIRSLVEQTLPPDQFEILVVDNASTDATPQVIESCQAQSPQHTIRRIYEPVPGSGRSRNAALSQAQGRYIGYIDDDARAAPNWLENALQMLEQPEHPVSVGGRILPFYTSSAPAWFKEEYESRTWGDQPRRLQNGEAFSGSNMIWECEALRSVGGNAENLGVFGDILSLGEESAAYKKLWQVNPSALVLYSPDLVVYHWAAPQKLSVRYYLQRAFASGQSEIRQRGRLSTGWRLRTLLRSSGGALLWTLRAPLRLRRYCYPQNWAVEEGRPILGKVGVALAVLGIYITVRQR